MFQSQWSWWLLSSCWHKQHFLASKYAEILTFYRLIGWQNWEQKFMLKVLILNYLYLSTFKSRCKILFCKTPFKTNIKFLTFSREFEQWKSIKELLQWQKGKLIFFWCFELIPCVNIPHLDKFALNKDNNLAQLFQTLLLQFWNIKIFSERVICAVSGTYQKVLHHWDILLWWWVHWNSRTPQHSGQCGDWRSESKFQFHSEPFVFDLLSSIY